MSGSHDIENTGDRLNRGVLVSDIDAVMLEVGAWPRYAPQMAESIVVQRIDGCRGGVHPHVTGEQVGDLSLYKSPSYVTYKIIWKDTEGHQHGRVWSCPNTYVQVNRVGQIFPLGCAQTEAGTVWIYVNDEEDWAEIQGRKGHAPRIAIERLQFDDDHRERVDLGLYPNMQYQLLPRPVGAPFVDFFFGDDMIDDLDRTVGPLGDVVELSALRRFPEARR